MAELPKLQYVGMAWFERDDYPRILQVMVDAHKLHRTYDEWKQASEQSIAQLEKRGLTVLRAIIKPEEFVSWCAANGMAVDSDARKRWGAEFAMRHLESGGRQG